MADVVEFGSDKPPWRPSRRLMIVAGLLLAGAGAIGAVMAALDDRGGPGPIAASEAAPPAGRATSEAAPPAGPPCVPVGWGQTPVVADPPAGLVVEQATGRPSGLVRCDRAAADGPWTVVVRRPDGTLGRHGAVVTFPVSAPKGGRAVEVGKVAGRAEQGTVSWPVARAYARIRGDLPESALTAIAARTTVVHNRPVVDPPAGYVVVASGPYRSPAVHEARYDTAEVGEQAALDNGLVYTGIAGGGGFEDQLYAVHARDGGRVAGRPAVVSPVYGGNATLAWEPAPGMVAYVGYSGATLDDAAAAALGRLAERSRVLNAAGWQAIDQQTADQPNEPG
ncbi:hypothetical protein ODJ79_09695 [Actinoplanes sp. KI2]|uniref:hypothetical protein n=1 Tax=Actinoplanes sp. KI2 TaxID=2983315 RepID=UPI0021D589DC|nr:hypothetical protein [Actinoplanes sp. KI2]MCU7723988.1 hypothetical protein [Actinoplanes sp. KI2]